MNDETFFFFISLTLDYFCESLWIKLVYQMQTEMKRTRLYWLWKHLRILTGYHRSTQGQL